jgi:hypothetical protein
MKSFHPKAFRATRVQGVLDFLRSRARGDGICIATTGDILEHLETSLGETVHARRVVLNYVHDLQASGELERVPFSPALGLPVAGRHGFRRGVLKLIPRSKEA